MVKRSCPPVRHTRHAEEMRARKRMRTTTRQNPFFEQLNYDVRRCIFDYLTLPPFPGAKSCTGMYLSCRQFKNEMDQAASVQLRNHLLNYQKQIAKESDGQVQVQLPQEIEIRPVPTDSVMDISVTMNAGSHKLEVSRFILALHEMLFGLNINVLHIHIDLPFIDLNYYTNHPHLRLDWTSVVSELLHQLLRSPRNDKPITHSIRKDKPIMRVRETIITWRAPETATGQAPEANTSPKALMVMGQKLQIANATPGTPYSYFFCHKAINCGAWIIAIPNLFEQGRAMSSLEFDMLTACDSHGHQHSLEFSKTTINSTTLQISDGKETTERFRNKAIRFYNSIEKQRKKSTALGGSIVTIL
ncbi:hypothetical protein Ptr902_11907 [Pyrenophora tritici-repentis]|nr:hypothetical protein Ptr902_13966 [Pyrenophora tritici-repentis]KAI2476560.1 hypothetical protein Ptr902_11907 [Pyrenophora tritici-repentis]